MSILNPTGHLKLAALCDIAIADIEKILSEYKEGNFVVVSEDLSVVIHESKENKKDLRESHLSFAKVFGTEEEAMEMIVNNAKGGKYPDVRFIIVDAKVFFSHQLSAFVELRADALSDFEGKSKVVEMIELLHHNKLGKLSVDLVDSLKGKRVQAISINETEDALGGDYMDVVIDEEGNILKEFIDSANSKGAVAYYRILS